MATVKRSVLNLQRLYFEKINFERKETASSNPKWKMSFNREVSQDASNSNHYKVALSTNMVGNEDEIKIEIRLIGEFILNNVNNLVDQEDLVRENGVAILFPYLRSEITLLTSQPELSPIVIPTVNIIEMFRKNER